MSEDNNVVDVEKIKNKKIKTRIKHKEELRRQNGLMSKYRRVSLVVYFIVIFIGSLYVTTMYWQVPTFDERLNYINSTINEMKSSDANSAQIAILEAEYSKIKSITGGLQEKKLTDWFLFSEVKNIVIIGAAGLLGGTVAGFRSLESYYGNRLLRNSWTYWYIFRPIQGPAIAIIVYWLTKAGFELGFNSQDGGFQLAAIGVVSGLFAEQVFAKIKEAVDTLLQKSKDQKDSLTIPQLYPSSVSAIVESAVYHEDVKVIFWAKGTIQIDKSSVSEVECRTALESDSAYWKVSVEEPDGMTIYWIRDSDGKVVCKT